MGSPQKLVSQFSHRWLNKSGDTCTHTSHQMKRRKGKGQPLENSCITSVNERNPYLIHQRKQGNTNIKVSAYHKSRNIQSKRNKSAPKRTHRNMNNKCPGEEAPRESECVRISERSKSLGCCVKSAGDAHYGNGAGTTILSRHLHTPCLCLCCFGENRSLPKKKPARQIQFERCSWRSRLPPSEIFAWIVKLLPWMRKCTAHI